MGGYLKINQISMIFCSNVSTPLQMIDITLNTFDISHKLKIFYVVFIIIIVDLAEIN